MKRLTVILLALAACLSAKAGVVPMEGAFLKNSHERDSILIGDRILYGFVLEDVTPGTDLALPYWSGELVDSVLVTGPWQADTLKTKRMGKGHKVYDVRMQIPLTSFDEGTFDLPPISVVRTLPGGDRDTLLFEGKSLCIKTLPIDTENFEPHDLKPQIKYPVTFKEVLPYIGGALGVAGLIALAVWLISRRKKKIEEEKKLVPAHIAALRKLEQYRNTKYWAPERQKAFYSGVTDALREYMSRRYEFGAMEMTTAEIFQALKGTDVPEGLIPGMKNLFETSDFVKFAKMTVDDETNAGVLPVAVKFVTDTFIPEETEDVL